MNHLDVPGSERLWQEQESTMKRRSVQSLGDPAGQQELSGLGELTFDAVQQHCHCRCALHAGQGVHGNAKNDTDCSTTLDLK